MEDLVQIKRDKNVLKNQATGWLDLSNVYSNVDEINSVDGSLKLNIKKKSVEVRADGTRSEDVEKD